MLKLLACLVVFLAVSVLQSATASADVVFVNKTSAFTGNPAPNSLTWTHPNPGGTQTILIVSIAVHESVNSPDDVVAIQSVTYNGDPLTLASRTLTENGDLALEVWYILNPDPGAGNQIVATLPTGTTANMAGVAYLFSGVDQGNPFNELFTGNNSNETPPEVFVDTQGPSSTIINFFGSRVDCDGLPEPEITTPGDPQFSPITEAIEAVVSMQNVQGNNNNVRVESFLMQDPANASQLAGFDSGCNATWAETIWSIRAALVTAVGVEKVEGAAYEGGVVLKWETGFESDNLGFHVYRERKGERVRVTPELVAGSALMTKWSNPMGFPYAFVDRGGTAADTYWIEDVDLSGETTLHGPFRPAAAHAKMPTTAFAPTLGDLTHRATSASRTYTGHLVGIVSPRGARAATTAGSGLSQFQIAASPAVKISVEETGLYRVSGADLAAAGMPIDQVDPRTVCLVADGAELAIKVTGEQDGRLDPSDTIEFFGSGVDRVSTDTRVYWLTWGSGAAKRMKLNNANPTGARTISFPSTVELDERLTYLSVVTNGEQGNFFGRLLYQSPVDHTLVLPSVDASAPTATLEVAAQGFSLQQHAVSVALNGVAVGQLTFTGEQNKVGTFTVPSSMLHEGANTVTLAAVGGGFDISFVDHVRITYSRRSVASGDELYLQSVQRGAIKVDGFASSQVRVFDVSNRADVTELSTVTRASGSGYSAEFQPLPQVNRQIYAVGASEIKQPASLVVNGPSTWNAASNGADLVVVTSGDLAAALAPLVALRQSQGYTVAVVDVEDLYDEFSFGYHDPAAIRSFVSHASRTWTKRPSALLLAGDATYDPRDYFGRGGEIVPTKFVDTDMNEAPSDEWLVDTTNDGIGEWIVGRLPVRTADQLSTVVGKIVAYEQTGGNRAALLVSDIDPSFTFHTEMIVPTIPGDVATSQLVRTAGTDLHQQVLDGLNAGPGFVHYAGHGGVLQWAGNILTNADPPSLVNDRLSIFAMSNCYNGYFAEPIHVGLGESLLLAEGGAVAVWAPTTSSYASEQRRPSQEFTRSMFAGTTLGAASRNAKQAASPAVRATWVLLGDPLTRLR